MSAEDFVVTLLKNFSEVFQPLIDAVTPLGASPPSTDALFVLLADFGWTLDSGANPTTIVGAFGSVTNDVKTLVGDAQKLDAKSSTDDITKVATDLGQTLVDIGKLSAAGANLNFSPFNRSGFWSGDQSFPKLLWPYLVHCYLRDHVSVLYGSLSFLGILTETPHKAATDGSRSAYTERQIDWARIPRYASDPGGTFANVYHWGDPAVPLDHASFIQGLGALFGALPLASGVDVPNDDVQALFYPGARPPDLLEFAAAPVPPFEISGPTGLMLKLVLGIIPIPTAGGTPPDPVGFALFPVLSGAASGSFQVTDTFSVTLEGHFQSIPVIVEFRPAHSGGVDAHVNKVTLDSLAAQTDVGGKVTLAGTAPSGSPWILVGSASSSHVELSGAHVAVTAVGPVNDLDYKVEVGLEGAKVVIDLSDADGFLQNAMGSKPQSVDLSCTLAWSRKAGFSFDGQANISAIIPIHQTFANVVDVDTLSVAMGRGGEAGTAALGIGVSGGLTLGPISASVEKVGVQLQFRHDLSGKGNLGEIDLQFGFLPPSGLGLDIEATAVSGGGFIDFDNEKGEYSGELELSIEMLQLKAFGLLDTKPEVSFVIIIIADFPPIELGFGFALTGVGGLLGINRTMSIDALRTSFRNHSLDKTLFLENPASQGGQIAQNIAAIFPIMDKHFVFGPFVQISWGEPILVSAELGFILTLPDPVRLAILGAIVAALPDPDDPIVILRLDVLGTIDFDKREIAIDASLYDSYVAAFSVAGDMAFRMNYGDKPDFALSLGGLNPRFQPPPGFPELKRLSISLGDGDNPRISVEGYLAITSNSVQFGAQAELTASAAGFGIHGYESFDALVMLQPFGFTIDFHAGIDLLHGSSVIMSIGVDGTLSGTSPWHIHGDGHIHVLFFDVSVSFDATFGQSAPAQNPPTITVIDKFTAVLKDARNWQALMPPDAGRVATLAAVRSTPEVIVIHPIGQLKFEQTLLPLDVQLAKFGSANISDANQFTVSGLVLNGVKKPLTDKNTIPGEFADAQFFNLSDDDKISKPSFTSHEAGATFDAEVLTVPALDVKETIVYNTIIREDDMQPVKTGTKYALAHDKALSMTGFGASAMNSRRSAGSQKYVPSGMKSGVTVNSPSYVVVNKTDMAVRKDISSSAGAGYASVQSRLSAYVAKNPSSKGALQIVPKYELPAR